MMQKMMSKPLMIAPQSLEILANIEWFTTEEKVTYNMCNGIAIIPICGLLTKYRECGSHFLGTVSYEEIFEMISSALDDSKINSILLDIDSPGGEVSGLFDFFSVSTISTFNFINLNT